MALVREVRVGGPGGAIVRIYDDEYAHLSEAELENRRRERNMVVRRMLENQIARGITPTFHEYDLPPMEVLYDRRRDGVRQEG